MRENRLRSMWNAGQSVINGWLAIPNAFAAEVMAAQNWDSLTIDLQHGLSDYQAMLGMLQAISTTQTVPMVRVPWLEPGILMKVLDAGAYGVICPMINSPEEARRFVACTSYPPRGMRSFGPQRALLYGGPDYLRHADDTIVRLAMIETTQGLDNLDAILAVEGLDGVYVGPADLSLALGCAPSFDEVAPKVAQAIDHIAARARAHRRIAGIHNGGPDAAIARIAKGFQFVTAGSDARYMATGAQQTLAQMRQKMPTLRSTGSAATPPASQAY